MTIETPSAAIASFFIYIGWFLVCLLLPSIFVYFATREVLWLWFGIAAADVGLIAVLFGTLTKAVVNIQLLLQEFIKTNQR